MTRAPTRGGLSGLLVLTDRRQAARPLPEVVAAAIDGGARSFVMREKDLSPSARRALLAQIAPLVRDVGGVVISAGHHLAGADGVHQAASGGPVPVASITGRSCHDEADVRAADDDGVDYVTVSPVWATASKPGYGPALGVAGLASLAASATLPVYALGGIETPDAVVACREAGAHGVAVMGAIMRAPEPSALVAELVAAADGAGR